MDDLKVFNYQVMSLICKHISHNCYNTLINDYSKIGELLEIRSKLLSKLDHNHCTCNEHESKQTINDKQTDVMCTQTIDNCYDQSNLSVKIFDRVIGDHTNDESVSESEMCTTSADTNTTTATVRELSVSHHLSERKPNQANHKSSKCGKTRNTSKSKTVLQFINCEAIEVKDKYGNISDDDTEGDTELVSDTALDTCLINESRTSLDMDMRAFYMQSVKSQLVGGPHQHKYKLQYNYDRSIDVYSQNANECEFESTDYEMDSFCVPNDCIIYDNTQQTDTQTISTNSNRFLSTHRKRRFKRIAFKP